MLPGLFNSCLSPLCWQRFVWVCDYSLLSNSRGELGVFVCLFVLGGGCVCFFFSFSLWDLALSPMPGLLYIKREFSTALNLYSLNVLTQCSRLRKIILNIFHLFLLHRENETAIKYLS